MNRIDTLAVRANNLALRNWRACVLENAETWANNYENKTMWTGRPEGDWTAPCTGMLGGVAYMHKDKGMMCLTDASTSQKGAVFWSVNPGRWFTLTFQFCTTGDGSTNPQADAVWVDWYLPSALYRDEDVYTSSWTGGQWVPGVPGASYRLSFDEFEGYSKVYGPMAAGSSKIQAAYPRTGTGGAWWTCTVHFSPNAAVVLLDKGTGNTVLHTFTPTASLIPAASEPTYMAFSARTGGYAAEHGLRNVTVVTLDQGFPGRDAQFLALNEMEFPTYTLVRGSRPPPRAVTFGVQLNTGPIYAGVCVTPADGLMPCKINPRGAGMAYYATNVAISTTNYFYVIPKPGFVAVRMPYQAFTSSWASTAVSVDRPGTRPSRIPVLLVAHEATNAFTYGRFEWPSADVAVTGPTIVCEQNGPLILSEYGDWAFVCVVPRTTRYDYVALPQGIVGSPVAGEWTANGTSGAAADEIAAAGEAAGIKAVTYTRSGSPVYTFKPSAPWPVVTAGFPGSVSLIRSDVLEAEKPPASVLGSSYTATDYVSPASRLRWRWNEKCGWYINMSRQTA